MQSVLIATLGTEAQIVPLSLLDLERQGHSVQEVVVVHTAAATASIDEAIQRLDEAFQLEDRLRFYRYHREPLQGSQGPIADVTTADEAEAVFDTLYRLVRRYKLDGYQVHLNVAGGRKPMSIYGMVVAQILFDEHDHLWHLVSDDALVQSRRLFPEPGDRYSLAPVPVIRWADVPPVETGVARAETAREAVHEQEIAQQERRLELFLAARLTLAEREVAHLLARGLSNQAIATERGAELSTVAKQVSAIYRKWRIHFDVPEKAPVRDAVVAELARYFARRDAGT